MTENLLWIEKYRPQDLTEIIGQDKTINLLDKMIDNGSLPHLILNGKSGTGKTSTIMSLINKLYGNNKVFNVIKLDASDDRGINTVRDEIKGFAEKITIFNKGIKLIILDEADAMTFDAQFALRRIMETYSDTTRFCFICNYDNKIIPAIKARCLNLRFQPINKDIIKQKLKNICVNEKIKHSTQSIDTISNICNGDLRKAINLLQSVSMRTNKITKKICYETAGIPDRDLVEYIFNFLYDNNNNFLDCFNVINEKLIKPGYSLSLFLNELVKVIITKDIEEHILSKYLQKLAYLENAVSISTFGNIYTISIIGIFKEDQ
jgi:replication factor C subunit 3/5